MMLCALCHSGALVEKVMAAACGKVGLDGPAQPSPQYHFRFQHHVFQIWKKEAAPACGRNEWCKSQHYVGYFAC